MRLVFIFAILVATASAGPNVCQSFTRTQETPGTWSSPQFYFGINDSQTTTGQTLYYIPFMWDWFDESDNPFNTNAYWDTDDMDAVGAKYGPIFINGIPLMGGKNYTQSAPANYVRTADFTCSNDGQTIMWGPLYPDYREGDLNMRGQYQYLETYFQWSAPNTTSYFRQIAFITNKSDKVERLHVKALVTLNYPSQDLSPVNNGRYVAGFPWHFSDPGQNPTIREASTVFPQSLHARGPKAREVQASVHVDHDCVDAGVLYSGKIAPEETKALMFVYALAPNVTRMLETSAWIDSEPAELFHDLNADQLSQIVNWGGCQSILGPDVTVTVTPPSSCSSGATSDFTASVSTSREELSSGFKHRVVVPQTKEDVEIVPAQSSTSLTVINDLGQVKHQLWYKSCLVKETLFTACVTTPSSPVSQSPTGEVSDGSLVRVSTSLIVLCAVMMRSSTTMRACVFVLVLLASNTFANSICHSFTKSMTTYDPEWTYPAEFNFGINDSPDREQTQYSVNMDFAWYTQGADEFNSNWWLRVNTGESSTNWNSIGTLMINGVYVLGGNDFLTYAAGNYVRTADFVCSNDNQTVLWGPAYPDFRGTEYRVRGQLDHLETYIQLSAPSTTSYLRTVVFVTNKGDTVDHLTIHQTNYFENFPNDLSPINDGRYFAPYPWLENDPGEGVKDLYSKDLIAFHARGPGARDMRAWAYIDSICWDGGLHYNGEIAAGETKALMFVFSFAQNVTRMLEHSAWIDTEPAELFHDLTADQLAQIVNWGACSVLAPDVTVTVTPPSSCSSGATSDFTVSVSTSRDDFTAGFTHRVIGALIKIEVVPAQSSTTLTVPNGANQLKHQLWYNGCLIKETSFTACARA